MRRSSAATSAAGRPSTSCGASPAADGLLEHERGGGGEPHPLPRGAQLVEPRQPGEEEVDGAVGVAQPHEHPQAGRHRVRGARVVLGQVPRPPERRDRAVDVAAVEPQLGVDRQARPRLVAAGEVPATTGATSSRARAGSLASTSRACSRSSHAWQSLRLSRGSASQAASSRSTRRVVADGLREPRAGRVHRPQVVAVAAEDLLDVVDGRHEGVEADLRQVLDEVDGPLQPPQHGVAVVLHQTAGRVERLRATRRSARGCAGRSGVQ